METIFNIKELRKDLVTKRVIELNIGLREAAINPKSILELLAKDKMEFHLIERKKLNLLNIILLINGAVGFIFKILPITVGS